MRDDVRAAVRSLASSKAFTTVALIVLTLGIGATTAIFSVVDAVVLRALPFDEHDRLVAVGERRTDRVSPDPTRDPLQLGSAAPQNYVDWAAQQQVFDSIAAIAGGAITYQRAGHRAGRSAAAQRVTAGFFDVLRSRPRLAGRSPRQRGRRPRSCGRAQRRPLAPALQCRSRDHRPIGSRLNGRRRTKSSASCRHDFAYPVGLLRPTDLWIPYVVPAERARPQSAEASASISRHRAAEAGRLASAGAGADGSDRGRDSRPRTRTGTRRSVGVRPLIDHILGARTNRGCSCCSAPSAWCC